MGLSAADIDRWNAEFVRDVFHAGTQRYQTSTGVARDLGTLSAFDTWEGDAADAARHAVATTRADLDAHGREALAVARAADRAADGVEKVKADLAQLRADAAAAGLEVDPVSNRIVAPPGSTRSRQQMLALPGLQARLDGILLQAALVDQELASAIDMADGDTPIPTDAGPPVGPEGLTPTQVASDANQERLRLDRATAAAEVAPLQKKFDDLMNKVYRGDHSAETADALRRVTDQLSPLRKHLDELDAVDEALGKAPDTYLTVYDPQTGTGKHVLAAVAVGNPDSASKIGVTVPGMGTTPQSLPGMVSEANNLRQTTQREMQRLGIPGTASTIAWLGYEPPAAPDPANLGSDLGPILNDDIAQAGARNLAGYLQSVDAANPHAQISLLGHSYGSLTSSLALQQLHDQGIHAVDDAVFYGSPGLELYAPSQLGLDPGHAFVMQAPQDFVTGVIAPTAALHGWGINPYSGILPELSSQAGVSPDGILREGVGGHADYPRAGSDGALRMSGYNLAAVVAGLPQEQLVMAPPLPISRGGR